MRGACKGYWTCVLRTALTPRETRGHLLCRACIFLDDGDAVHAVVERLFAPVILTVSQGLTPYPLTPLVRCVRVFRTLPTHRCRWQCLIFSPVLHAIVVRILTSGVLWQNYHRIDSIVHMPLPIQIMGIRFLMKASYDSNKKWNQCSALSERETREAASLGVCARSNTWETEARRIIVSRRFDVLEPHHLATLACSRRRAAFPTPSV